MWKVHCVLLRFYIIHHNFPGFHSFLDYSKLKPNLMLFVSKTGYNHPALVQVMQDPKNVVWLIKILSKLSQVATSRIWKKCPFLELVQTVWNTSIHLIHHRHPWILTKMHFTRVSQSGVHIHWWKDSSMEGKEKNKNKNDCIRRVIAFCLSFGCQIQSSFDKNHAI